MTARILTPESHAYGLAIAVVLCLGVYTMSTLVQSQWLAPWRRIHFWQAHLGSLSLVILWCSLVVDPTAMFRMTSGTALLSLAVGILLGVVSTKVDRAVVRYARRGETAKRRGRNQPQRAIQVAHARGWTLRGLRTVGASVRMAAGHGPAPHVGRSALSTSASPSKRQSTLWLLILVGGFEEIIFRGFLVQLCFMIPWPAWTAAALVGTVVFFGVAHVQFGWIHVAGKLPLGTLALASVLLVNVVLPAIIIHAFFNWSVWRDTDGDIETIFRSGRVAARQ